MDKTVKKIIDYLKGERFAYVEPKDVEFVAAMVKGGMYFEGIDELHVLYDELLDKYVKEAINFYNFLYSKHDLGFSYLARVCEVLPFKKSRNPLIDMMILLKFNRVDLYDKSIITTPEGFWNVIRILLSTGHIMWNNNDYRNKELIIKLEGLETLTFENFMRNKYVSRVESVHPVDFEDAQIRFLCRPSREYVGDYGEYVAEKYLSTIKGPDRLLWVSKDVGDGYGYDFLLYNDDLMKYIPFEVKAAKLEESYKNPNYTYTEEKFKIEQAKYGRPYNLLKILLDGYSGGVVKSELQVHDGSNLSIMSDPLPTGEVLTRIRK